MSGFIAESVYRTMFVGVPDSAPLRGGGLLWHVVPSCDFLNGQPLRKRKKEKKGTVKNVVKNVLEIVKLCDTRA